MSKPNPDAVENDVTHTFDVDRGFQEFHVTFSVKHEVNAFLWGVNSEGQHEEWKQDVKKVEYREASKHYLEFWPRAQRDVRLKVAWKAGKTHSRAVDWTEMVGRDECIWVRCRGDESRYGVDR